MRDHWLAFAHLVAYWRSRLPWRMMARVTCRNAVTLCTLLLALISSDVLLPKIVCADAGPVVYTERDTLLTGCELYLFGRLVEPIEYQGAKGIVVRRTIATVTINNIVFFDSNAPPRKAVIRPEALAASRAKFAVFNPIALSVREAVTFLSADSVLVNGKRPEYGKKLLHSRAADGVEVWIEYTPSGFSLTYKDDSVFYSYRTPQPLDPTDEARRKVEMIDTVYRRVVSGLRPGAIVLMGKGYTDTYFDPARYDALRHAMTLIPKMAKRIEYPDVYGLVNYEALDIGGFHFSPAVVRDFVSASSSEDRIRQ